MIRMAKMNKNTEIKEKGKSNRLSYLKVLIAIVAVAVMFFFAFTVQIREGSGAIFLKFGAPKKGGPGRGTLF